jgi:hypothetical protein
MTNLDYLHLIKRGIHCVHASGTTTAYFGHLVEGSNSAQADGVFGRWSWDGVRLTVKNDRYGFFPLFYHCDPGRFMIGRSPLQLLALGAPKDLNVPALSVFFRLGFFTGEDTPFKHIKVVPPGSDFVWDGVLRVRGQRPLGVRTEIARPAAIDAYVELFRASMGRRLPREARFGMPLSGGRDSRHILLELVRRGHRPSFVVTGADYSGRVAEDLVRARELAGAIGVKHIEVRPSSRFDDELRSNLLTCFLSDEHSWILPIAEALAARTSTTYDGIAGDVLSASLFQDRISLEHFQRSEYEQLATRFLGPKDANHEALLPAELRQHGGYTAALERIVAELARYDDSANPLSMFFFWNRTRREIALSPFILFSDIPTCFCPYLDHDLYDFLAGIPPVITLDRGFHTEAIRRAYPNFSHIPFSFTSPKDTSMTHKISFTSSVLIYALRRKRSASLRDLNLLRLWAAAVFSAKQRSALRWLSPSRLLYMTQLRSFLDGV